MEGLRVLGQGKSVGREGGTFFLSGVHELTRKSIIHPNFVNTAMVVGDSGERAFPIDLLKVEDVSDAIVKQVLSASSGSLVLPGWQAIAKGVRALPSWLQEWIRDGQQGLLRHVPATGLLTEEQKLKYE
jgi:hypothetical protein